MSVFRWRCSNCGHEVEREHNGLRPPAGDCPSCATDMLEAVIEAGCVGTREGRRARAGAGYHPGLARYPNDPEANVESYGQLQKLIAKRQRQSGGAEVRRATDIRTDRPKPAGKPFRQLLKEEEGRSL